MARLSGNEGGWFKVWGRKWLMDDKLRAAGREIELDYLRTLCLANVKFKNGYFIGDLDENMTMEDICKGARIEHKSFKTLISMGFLSQEKDTGAYYITKWEMHQTPWAKKHPETLEKPRVSVDKPIPQSVIPPDAKITA
jgi:hypothetical protein